MGVGTALDQVNCFNVRTLAPQVTGLSLQQSPGQITGSFNGVDIAWPDLVKGYRVVIKAGGIPTGINDGTVLTIQPQRIPIYSFTVPATNGVLYGVRVFVEGPGGFQTSEIARGQITPVAGLRADSFAVGTRFRIKINGVNYSWLNVNVGLPSSIYDASCNGVWALLEAIYEERQWNSSNVNDYANSTINTYLNGTFPNLIEAAVRSQIKQVKIPYRVGNSGTTINSGASGLSVKAFLLSVCEAGWSTSDNGFFVADGSKLDYFISSTSASANGKRVALLNGTASSWLFKTPSIGNNAYIWSAKNTGAYQDLTCVTNAGIRPCIILPRDMFFNPAANSDGTFSPL